jgi:predicted phage gp36 major capsid-like protein
MLVRERSTSVDTGNSLERGEEWARVERLIALARSAHRTELSPERRAEIREKLLLRWEREQNRRRTVRAFLAGASTTLVVGLLVQLVTANLSWFGQSWARLTR